VAHDLRANLDELLPQARQRPVFDRLGRGERAQEVAAGLLILTDAVRPERGKPIVALEAPSSEMTPNLGLRFAESGGRQFTAAPERPNVAGPGIHGEEPKTSIAGLIDAVKFEELAAHSRIEIEPVRARSTTISLSGQSLSCLFIDPRERFRCESRGRAIQRHAQGRDGETNQN
jgi:hypothetical protein